MNYIVNFDNILSENFKENINILNKRSFKDDIYGQILLMPKIINAGNISNNVIYKTVLWNATLDTKTLTNINEYGTNGILLNGPAQKVMSSNSFLEYSLEITTQGDSFIDAKYDFIFQTGESIDLKISGSRVVLFDFPVNWAKLPVESYSHNTDVRVSYDGTEHRFNLSENPRLMLEYFYTLTDKDRMLIDGMLYSWADKLFLVPIYSQLTYLKNNVLIDDNSCELDLNNSTLIQKDISILFTDGKDKKEIMNIEKIENEKIFFTNKFTFNWNKNTFVLPLTQSYINSTSKTSHQTTNLTEIIATFSVKDDTINTINNNIDNFEEYEGLKLLTAEPNRKITIDREYARLVDVIDYGSGVRSRVSKDKKPAIVFNYTFDCIGKQEINNLKAFFNNMKGMADEFLVSSFTTDIKLNKSVLADETTLIIENTGVGTYYFNNEQKDLIIFYLKNGKKFIRKIINVLYDSENTERLIIDKNFGEKLEKDEIGSVQFLSHARFNTDTLDLEYETDEYSRCNTEIRILRG